MMNLSSLGGEFELINRYAKKPRNKEVVVSIGDDTAVLKRDKSSFWLFTKDTFVEDDHFSRIWFTPKQIGSKAIEANVSDIAAMGGSPKFALLSIVVPGNVSVGFMDKFYSGINSSCRKYGIDLVGGDTTHGKQFVVSVTLLGTVKKKNLCLRSAAKPGDFIMVSGELGASTVGLQMFLKKKKGFANVKKFHTEPKAQLKKSEKIAPYVNAMEDCSDGLASEVRNICRQSKCGAVIYRGKVPVSDETAKAAGTVCIDAIDAALFGGEDFELVFTVSQKNIKKVNGFIVGEIIKGKKIYLEKNGIKKELKKFGYDHFLAKR
ncbi:MAG: thiamine-phosphate kinase [Candidatus Diapherotrites archaeon]